MYSRRLAPAQDYGQPNRRSVLPHGRRPRTAVAPWSSRAPPDRADMARRAIRLSRASARRLRGRGCVRRQLTSRQGGDLGPRAWSSWPPAAEMPAPPARRVHASALASMPRPAPRIHTRATAPNVTQRYGAQARQFAGPADARRRCAIGCGASDDLPAAPACFRWTSVYADQRSSSTSAFSLPARPPVMSNHLACAIREGRPPRRGPCEDAHRNADKWRNSRYTWRASSEGRMTRYSPAAGSCEPGA